MSAGAIRSGGCWAALASVVLLGLAACASAPPPAPPTPPEAFLHDSAFAPPTLPVDPDAALRVSPAMRDYLAAHFHVRVGTTDRRRDLIEALYRPGDLRLEYDAETTRTAAEAFEARSGNCLALVLMTAAFAKELGLAVHYQQVLGETAWDRADELYFAIGHVNLSLEDRWRQTGMNRLYEQPLLVDFLPPRAAQQLSTRELSERTVIAMYLNNRAVETLAHGGRPDEAYAWARAAIREDPAMASAFNTLGVIYRGARHPDWALDALGRAAALDPGNLDTMGNRVLALRDLGRMGEADALARQLAALDPHPPYADFRAGLQARREGHFEEARRLFAKEVARDPDNHEFEFWLAISWLDLKDPAQAALHLRRAMEASTTRRDRALYAAKLERLKAAMQ